MQVRSSFVDVFLTCETVTTPVSEEVKRTDVVPIFSFPLLGRIVTGPTCSVEGESSPNPGGGTGNGC